MRTALLNATLDTLVDSGYKGTTTTAVAHRANVSLGALLHHFPTKADLLAAAVGHACDRRLAEFRESITAAGAATDDQLDTAIDLLWTMMTGPTYTAFVELWVAARTEPELAATLVVVDQEFARASERIYEEVAGSAIPFPRAGLDMTMALMGGLAQSRMISGYTPFDTAAVVEIYKALVRTALQQKAAP